MIEVKHSNELVQFLASRIAGTDHHWFIDVAELLERQSDDVLSDLLLLSEGFGERHWGSVFHTLRDFISNSGVPDNTHLVKDALPSEEFGLKVVFLLVPMGVVHHERSIGKRKRYLETGKTFDVENMYDSVTSDVYRVLSNLLPREASFEIARGCYMTVLFGRRHGGSFIPAKSLRWLAEHALEVIPIAESVFDEGVFDQELAELMIKAEPALRVGVL